MKILFNTYPFAFQSPGGGEVVLLKLMHALKKKGVEVDLFNQWETKIINYDIIHHFATLDFPVFQNYKNANIPLVITPTIWPRASKKSIIQYKLKRLIKKILSPKMFDLADAFNCADIILPTTKLELKRIKDYYNIKTEMAVVSNGVDLPAAPNNNSEIAKNLNLSKYFLFVGNISPVKNLHKIIEICEEMQYHLIIVGAKKEEYASYYGTCKNLAQKHTHFIGALDNNSSQLNDLYYHAHAVVIPSEFETCSLVGLEAAIRGKEVLITKHGGTTEVFENRVTYIDPNNLNDLKDCLKQCFAKPMNKNESLSLFTQDNYSWDAIAEKVLRFYNLLLK